MCRSCHVISVAVEFRSLNALEAACRRIGWSLNRGQTTYKWYGRWMDDTPAPRILFDSDAEHQRVMNMDRLDRIHYMNNHAGKCHHAIHIPGMDSEIGLIRQGNNYVPVFDYYGSEALNENGIAGLVQAYAIEAAKLEAVVHGHFCTEQTQEDGTVRLHIQISEY